MINTQKANYTETVVKYIQEATNGVLEKGFILIELIFKEKTPNQIIAEFELDMETMRDRIDQIMEGYRQ